MYTKKTAAALLALCLLTLSSCGKSGTEGTVSATGSETTASEAASTETTVETSAEAENTDTEITDDTDGVTDGNEDGSNNPLMPIVDAVLAANEWPSLWEVTDKQLISDYFTLDAENENYKNLLIMQCPMSANMSEIIIIEADDVNAAKADLEARREKAQNIDAFYPNDVDRAGASIVGTEGNYAYFVMGDPAADAETVIVDSIKGMN